MADVTITKINDTFMKVSCREIATELDIQDKFSFKVPKAKFDPRVRAGKWDGIKRLYNRRTKRMYTGLLIPLLSFFDKQGVSVDIDPALYPNEDEFTEEDLSDIVENLIQPKDDAGNPIELYDYQAESILHMINMNRSTCLAATSAGKSLILYIAARLYQLMDELEDRKIFIAVPSINLVEQLYTNFKEFATGTNWNVDKHCQRVTSKHPKNIDKQIVISTWQSMQKMPLWMFEDCGAIFVDECHTASADVLTRLIESATACPFRHGLTGTLDGTECNEMVIQGLLGPKRRFVTAKEIIDQGRASDIAVNVITLKYPAQDAHDLAYLKQTATSPTQSYQTELDFLYSHERRNNLLLDVIHATPGNTLVLFDRVENYGKKLYEEYCKRFDNPAFLITGDTDSSEREHIRVGIENHDNAIIFATYSIMQQGVSIKKLHNMFAVSSSRSQIRVLQSIGRLMRLHTTKKVGQIYDVVDSLPYDGKANHVLDHIEDRLQFYIKEQFKVNFIDLKIPE